MEKKSFTAKAAIPSSLPLLPNGEGEARAFSQLGRGVGVRMGAKENNSLIAKAAKDYQ